MSDPDVSRCDPDRPRTDVFVCAAVWSHPQSDGTGRVIDAFRVRSRGENFELDDCPAVTFTAGLWRPQALTPEWIASDAHLCKSNGYTKTFTSVAGIRVPDRSRFSIAYRQHIDFDSDVFGHFGIGVR